MTVRRRLHVFAGSGNEDQYCSNGAFRGTNSTVGLDRMMAPPNIHPALTDFGPDSLTTFVHGQIQQNQENGSSDTMNEPSFEIIRHDNGLNSIISPAPLYNPFPRPSSPTRPLSREAMQDLQARDIQAREAIKPATVSLAPNALRHLRGFRDAPTASITVPAADTTPGPPGRISRASPRKRNNSERSPRSDDENQGPLGSPRRSLPAQMHNISNSSPSRRLLASPRRRGRGSGPVRQWSRPMIVEDNPEDNKDIPRTANTRPDIVVVRSAPPAPTSETAFNYLAVLPTGMPDFVAQLGPPVGDSTSDGRSPKGSRRRAFLRRRGLRLFPAATNSSSLHAAGAPDGDSGDGDDDSDGDDLFEGSGTPDLGQSQVPSDPRRRVFRGTGPSPGPNSPPYCPSVPNYAFPALPADIWVGISEYLSFKDIQSLRMVNRSLMELISPVQFRNMVAPFNMKMPALVGTDEGTSIMANWGGWIHRFGVAFEFNATDLAFAQPKQSMQTQQAWYGEFQWPTSQYPRNDKLKALEDLVAAGNPMLPVLFSQMPKVMELGLSVDSGHGWLEGPDISDMALFNRRQKGSPVFGQKFPNEHAYDAYSRDEYFKWAQENAINKSLLSLASGQHQPAVADAARILSNLVVRERESFKAVASQPDFDPFSHTGGQAGSMAPNQNIVQPPAPPLQGGGLPVAGTMAQHLGAAGLAVWAQNMWRTRIGAANPTLNGRPVSQDGQPQTSKKQRPVQKIPLQWPLIFNGVNIAAETGGLRSAVRCAPADPLTFPLKPGSLTEAQVQWLMEQWWAQEHFLITYTHAIIANEQQLKRVKVLNIAKISSGLLPALAQPKFWAALPGLKELKLLVSPDWRSDHRPQAVFVQKSLHISPLEAVGKFAKFLQDFICPNENLQSATLGWVGGGEHAVGICARNQHLLPAPIIFEPSQWMSSHTQTTPQDPNNMVKFDHIRELTFENCWFSPHMLETFMDRSKDTSLHTLTLKSVSMLARHNSGTFSGYKSTSGNDLKCAYPEEDWLYEGVPASATWFDTLDRITPGVTFLERKYAAGIIDQEEKPKPERVFRGHVQEIVLKSCGYAMIEGVPPNDFNQEDLVMQPPRVADAGLEARARILRGSVQIDSDDSSYADLLARHGVPRVPGDKHKNNTLGPLMLRCPSEMSESSRTWSDEWRGMGTLTQCIHPVEKRLLEQAWGMHFGWGDTLDRWAPVEDGYLEGGTGRFTGVISAGRG